MITAPILAGEEHIGKQDHPFSRVHPTKNYLSLLLISFVSSMSPAKSTAMSPPPIAISKEGVLGPGRRVRRQRAFKARGLTTQRSVTDHPLDFLASSHPCLAQDDAAAHASLSDTKRCR
jgi:hypothetical protein